MRRGRHTDRRGSHGYTARGLSLAETVLAATMIALALLALLTLLPATMGLVQRNRETNVATYLAHDTLEWLAAKPYGSLLSGEQDLSSLAIPSPYQVKATVGTVAGHIPQRLKRLEVSVTWPHRDRTLSVQQELYIHGVRR